jgi:hypothetical protein
MKTRSIITLSMVTLLLSTSLLMGMTVEDVVYEAFESELKRRPTKEEFIRYTDLVEDRRLDVRELRREIRHLDRRSSGPSRPTLERNNTRFPEREYFEKRRWVESAFEEHTGRLPTRTELDEYCDICLEQRYSRDAISRRIAADYRQYPRENYDPHEVHYDFDRYSSDAEVEWIIGEIFREELDQEVDDGSMRKYRRLMIDRGWSERRVREDILSSPELMWVTNQKIVVRAYEDLLDRRPSVQERDAYVRDMIDRRWDEQRLRDAIRKSREYTYDRPRNMIDKAYRETLLREPDAGAYSLVREIVRRDWSLDDVNDHLRKSHEYRTNAIPKIINLVYDEMLQREPDDYGIQFYGDRLREGWTIEQMRTHVRASDEYAKKHGNRK